MAQNIVVAYRSTTDASICQPGLVFSPTGLHSIELSVLDKVELGHSIVASVVVKDTRGIPLPSHLHMIMGLKVRQ